MGSAAETWAVRCSAECLLLAATRSDPAASAAACRSFHAWENDACNAFGIAHYGVKWQNHTLRNVSAGMVQLSVLSNGADGIAAPKPFPSIFVSPTRWPSMRGCAKRLSDEHARRTFALADGKGRSHSPTRPGRARRRTRVGRNSIIPQHSTTPGACAPSLHCTAAADSRALSLPHKGVL